MMKQKVMMMLIERMGRNNPERVKSRLRISDKKGTWGVWWNKMKAIERERVRENMVIRLTTRKVSLGEKKLGKTRRTITRKENKRITIEDDGGTGIAGKMVSLGGLTS